MAVTLNEPGSLANTPSVTKEDFRPRNSLLFTAELEICWGDWCANIVMTELDTCVVYSCGPQIFHTDSDTPKKNRRGRPR